MAGLARQPRTALMRVLPGRPRLRSGPAGPPSRRPRRVGGGDGFGAIRDAGAAVLRPRQRHQTRHRNWLADSDFRLTNHGDRQHLAAGGVQGDQLDEPQRLPGRLIDPWCPESKLVRCSGIRVHRNVTPVVSIRNFMMGVSCLLDDRPNGVVGRITQCSPTPAAATNGGLKHTARVCKTVRCLAPSCVDSRVDTAPASACACRQRRQRGSRVGCAATAHMRRQRRAGRCRRWG